MSCQQHSKNPPVQAEGSRQAEPGVRGQGAGGLSRTSARETAISWKGPLPLPDGIRGADWGRKALSQPERRRGHAPRRGDGARTQCTGNSSARLQSPRTRISNPRDCSPRGQDHPPESGWHHASYVTLSYCHKRHAQHRSRLWELVLPILWRNQDPRAQTGHG